MKIKFLWLMVMLTISLLRNSEAGELLSFSGQVNVSERKFDVVLNFSDGGMIIGQVSSLGDGFRFTTKLVHVKTPTLDLSTELEGAVEKLPGHGPSRISGTFKTQYSLVNFKPIDEFSGRFEVSRGQLALRELSCGGLSLDGSVGLFFPHEINLLVRLNEMNLERLLAMLGYKGEGSSINGTVSGNMKISGPIDQLLIKSSLKARNGFIQDIEYSIFNLNFEGVYPIVRINDSNILKTDGLGFNLAGDFDLSKGQAGLEQGLVGLEKFPLVESDGVESEWTIRRKEEEGTDRVTEFKYRVDKSQQDRKYNKDSDMLGVQQSIKF